MPDQYFPTNPMVITLDHFNKMRDNFKKHYFLGQCNANFGGQEIQVAWNSFSLAVQNFISATEISADNVAVRFVHCYDAVNNVLYVRMQICKMEQSIIPNVFTIVPDPCVWYQLSNGTIMPTTNTTLSDQPYLDNFYYCDAAKCSPDSLHRLADDTAEELYARTVTLPWGQELAQLYTDNGSPTNATLCIDAGSPLTIITPAVKFQHDLMLYLRKNDGTPMLDNNEGQASFYYKAADFGTMCPPNCGIYILPPVL